MSILDTVVLAGLPGLAGWYRYTVQAWYVFFLNVRVLWYTGTGTGVPGTVLVLVAVVRLKSGTGSSTVTRYKVVEHFPHKQ